VRTPTIKKKKHYDSVACANFSFLSRLFFHQLILGMLSAKQNGQSKIPIPHLFIDIYSWRNGQSAFEGEERQSTARGENIETFGSKFHRNYQCYISSSTLSKMYLKAAV
jgi:hypothetical protein